jgi:hypothetical protein
MPLAIALSPFSRVIANTSLGDIDGLAQYLKLQTLFYTTVSIIGQTGCAQASPLRFPVDELMVLVG